MQNGVALGMPSGEPRRRRVYVDPDEVDSRLSELALRRDVLVDAVKRGLLARLECTPNDPLTAPGYNAWQHTVRALRELSYPLGYAPNNSANQGLVINERLALSINIAGGDKWTGRTDGIPSTRSKKGPSMASAVRANTMSLFDDMEYPNSNRGSWLLLAYWDANQQKIQLELSYPIAWDDERPVDYSERILLPDISHSDPSSSMVDPFAGEPPKTPEIKVEIKRRA